MSSRVGYDSHPGFSLFLCFCSTGNSLHTNVQRGLNGISDSVLGIRIIWRQMVLFLCNLSDQ